jgi:hypothetical protein
MAHAGGKHQPACGFFVDREPILDDFQVRMIEARINEAGLPFDRRRAASSQIVEKIATLFCRLEDEGGGQKHRCLDRPFRETRIIAASEHQRFGIQLVFANFHLAIARGAMTIPFESYRAITVGGSSPSLEKVAR